MDIIKYPLTTEKSVRGIDVQNQLVFVVDQKASKADIKAAIEELLSAKVARVNTHNANGEKRAYVTFTAETPAIDIATKLGLM